MSLRRLITSGTVSAKAIASFLASACRCEYRYQPAATMAITPMGPPKGAVTEFTTFIVFAKVIPVAATLACDAASALLANAASADVAT